MGEPNGVNAGLDLPDQEYYRDQDVRGYNGILREGCKLTEYDRMIERAKVQVQVDVICNLDNFLCEIWINQQTGPRIRRAQKLKYLI